MLGFDTVSDNQTILGGIFADNMFGGSSSPYSHSLGAHLTVVQAWALAAIISNGDANVWAAMGPYGAEGISDVNDRFWGFGPTGPDIGTGFTKGYWRLSGRT